MTRLISFVFAVSAGAMCVGCAEPESDEKRVWEDESGIVELVDLSLSEEQALLEAPESVLKGVPSDALAKALNGQTVKSTKIQLVRDKVDGKPIDETPPTYQGWVYYEAETLSNGEEITPTVLCVSQADPVRWTHCQEMSAVATHSAARSDGE